MSDFDEFLKREEMAFHAQKEVDRKRMEEKSEEAQTLKTLAADGWSVVYEYLVNETKGKEFDSKQFATTSTGFVVILGGVSLVLITSYDSYSAEYKTLDGTKGYNSLLKILCVPRLVDGSLLWDAESIRVYKPVTPELLARQLAQKLVQTYKEHSSKQRS